MAFTKRLRLRAVPLAVILLNSILFCSYLVLAQQNSEQPSTPSPVTTPTAKPSTDSCYRIDLNHAGQRFSGLASLGFNGPGQTFQYDQNGSCLAQKINLLYPKFVYRFFPNPNDAPRAALGAWQEGCQADCKWRAVIANQVIDPAWPAQHQANWRLMKAEFPLLSQAEYLNPPIEPFCSAYGPCTDDLSSCMVRCKTTQNRQCFYRSWCLANGDPPTQRSFCSNDLKSGNELCKGEVNYADDDAVGGFLSSIFDSGWPEGTDKSVSCSEAIPAEPPADFIAANCQGMTTAECTSKYTRVYSHTIGHCVAGTFTLDSNCKRLTRAEATQCLKVNETFVRWLPSSPISLIWTPGTSLREHAHIVSFKVDRSSKNSSFTWFASADTPLLVYDPEHKGTVSSAQQLFGNWTFGGRALAKASNALSEVDVHAQHPQPWRDGYEALATLDTNDDGSITGEELAPLALWFDGDGDAHTQHGEVRDIRDAGVTALFLGPTRKNLVTRDISVARGFRRIKAGKALYGETVDWFSDSAFSPQALVQVQELASVSKEPSKEAEETHAALADEGAIIPSYPADPIKQRDTYVPRSPLTGLWAWQSDNSHESLSSPTGVIAIRERRDGALEIVTMSELPVTDSSGKVRSFAKFNFMNGTVTASDRNSKKIQFQSPKDASSKTTARLDTKSGILSGTTTQQISEIRGTKKVTYEWTAQRISPLLSLPR